MAGEFGSALSIVRDISGIILLVLTYTYLDKLEKIGCVCAEHPYRKFIKGYTLFAIGFLAVTMFVPLSAVTKMFGALGGFVYYIINLAFVIATVVYFALVLVYSNYLIKAKCACSADYRREVMAIYAIIELIILGFLVVLPRALEFVALAYNLFVKTSGSVSGSSADVLKSIRDPFSGLGRVPKAFNSDVAVAKKTFKKPFTRR